MDQTTTEGTTMSPSPTRDAQLVRQLRWALVGLSVLTCLGSALELAMLRHWGSTDQKIPWVILVIMAAGIAAFAWRQTQGTILAARVLAVGSVLGSGFGVLEHVKSNVETAPLNALWADTWDTLSPLNQWWLAATGGAGAAPTLAPGFLALTGICLALATWRLRPGDPGLR